MIFFDDTQALLTGVRTSPSSHSSAVSSPVGGAGGGGGYTNMDGFDPDIHVDNLKGEIWNASPIKAKSRSASRFFFLILKPQIIQSAY